MYANHDEVGIPIRRRTTALCAVGALIAGTALALSAPAAAGAEPSGSTITLGASGINFSDTRYDGHNVVESGDLHIWTDNATSLAKAAGYFDVGQPLADVGEPTIAQANNSGGFAGMQMVTDFDGDGSADAILVGEPTVYGDDWWVSSSALQFVKNGAPSSAGGFGSDWHGTLDQWRAAFPDAQVLQGGYSLGSGIAGDDTISSITYGGTAYTFSDAVAHTDALRPVDVDLSQSRPAGHSVFDASDLHVTTDNAGSTAKAAGYFDLHGGALPLSQVGQSTLDWTPNGDSQRPGVQLVLDENGDGTPDAILVGEQTFGDSWWAASIANTAAGTVVKNRAPSCNQGSACTPAGYRQYNGSLTDWSAALPNAKVLQGGYSLGSGAEGDGLLTGITIGDTKYTFTDATADDDLIHQSDFIPELSDTRANGHVTFGASDLHVKTDGSSDEGLDGTNTDKAAEYFATTSPVALSDPGQPALNWTGTNPPPGNQLIVDFAGTGSEADPDFGTLVGEPVYGDDYWLTGGSPADVKALAPSCDPTDPTDCTGGAGSQWHGTLVQWAAAFPEAHIVDGGFSLGSGVAGDGTISSIVLGDTTYTFASSPTDDDVTATTTAGHAVAIPLTASGDHGPFTFTHGNAGHGTITTSGSTLTYTPDPGFVGTDETNYTATDGLGGTATASVTVTVTKAASTLHVTALPVHRTSAEIVKLAVAVTSTGSTAGGTVSATVNGRSYHATVVHGVATVSLTHYVGGSHTAAIAYSGTASTLATTTATVPFYVYRVASSLTVRVTPASVTTKTRATAAVLVTAPGAAAAGAKIGFRLGTRTLGTATVVKGRVRFTLPLLAKGTHTLNVTFGGSPTAAKSAKSVTIHVTG